jgi:long-chain acyl-CoA synthetase
MNIAQLLQRTALANPERPAVLHGEDLILNYGELAKRAAKLAGYFRQVLDLSEGSRVAMFMKNCPEYLEILYGAWWAGMVVVPVNAKLHPRELTYVLRNSQADCLFVTEDLAADVASAVLESELELNVVTVKSTEYEDAFSDDPQPLKHRSQDDVAWLFYTSGTTGNPKGVMQTHRNLLTMTSCYFSDVDAVSPDDAAVYAAPISHGAGMYNFAHVLKGAKHVIPRSGGFDCEELCGLSQSVGRLSMFAAPTMVKRLVEHIEETGSDASGFKTIVYGGGPMYLEDIRKALAVMGNRLVQVYGQGECPMTITALSREQLANREHPRWTERVGSVGVAQSLVEVCVTDAGGNPLPHGETGEVTVRGDVVMAGYWQNNEATANAIRGGWLWTGDMGFLDQDGFLTLKDRSKDVIISGGTNIYPREVEEVLLRHSAVREVSVIGVTDSEWGEAVVAFVVGDVTAEELDALCLQNIARFKRPKQYHFLQVLPKNNYGKVLKTELRGLLTT